MCPYNLNISYVVWNLQHPQCGHTSLVVTEVLPYLFRNAHRYHAVNQMLPIVVLAVDVEPLTRKVEVFYLSPVFRNNFKHDGGVLLFYQVQ